MQYDYILKIALIGDNGVGKSSFLAQYTGYPFNEKYTRTMGNHFANCVFKIGQAVIKLQIWDLSPDYRGTPPYRGAHGIIVLYDATNPDSFDSLREWFAKIDRYASEAVKKMIVANKCDSVDRKVAYETGKEFSWNIPIYFASGGTRLGIPFVETSVKNGVNVEEAIITLVLEILTNPTK